MDTVNLSINDYQKLASVFLCFDMQSEDAGRFAVFISGFDHVQPNVRKQDSWHFQPEDIIGRFLEPEPFTFFQQMIHFTPFNWKDCVISKCTRIIVIIRLMPPLRFSPRTGVSLLIFTSKTAGEPSSTVTDWGNVLNRGPRNSSPGTAKETTASGS